MRGFVGSARRLALLGPAQRVRSVHVVVPLLDFRELRSGQLYRVVSAFRDGDGREHVPGEGFTYLTRSEAEDGSHVDLWVRDAAGRLGRVRLAGAASATQVPRCLERVEETPLGDPAVCLCEGGAADWATVFSAPTVSVELCCRCSLVLALEPIAGGSRRVPLDEAERSAVLQANAVRFDAQLPELVSTFVACHSFYPAGLMVLTCLSRRNGLDQELSAALEAADPELRLSALQFLRHVPELPAGAEIGPLRVLRSFLNSQRTDSEECLELVRVLSRVPERITAYRMEVAHLRELARQDSRRTARKVRYETQELLRRIDLELEQRDGRVAAATAVLRALVLRGDFDEAKAWLARCETLGGVHELLGRAHLSEAAGDRVASERPPAAEWLYERAQESFDRYAALSPSGEGRARSRHVRRVALKLARLRGLAPSAPENSEQDSWLPPPIQPAATANADDFE